MIIEKFPKNPRKPEKEKRFQNFVIFFVLTFQKDLYIRNFNVKIKMILLPVAPLYRWGDHTFKQLWQILHIYQSDGLLDV